MPKSDRPSPAEFQVLLALVDGPKHGHAIKIDVMDRTEGAVEMGPGTLYGAVKRLLRRGWIADVTDDFATESDDGRLRYYEATTGGLDAARAEALHLSSLVAIAWDKALIDR